MLHNNCKIKNLSFFFSNFYTLWVKINKCLTKYLLRILIFYIYKVIKYYTTTHAYLISCKVLHFARGFSSYIIFFFLHQTKMMYFENDDRHPAHKSIIECIAFQFIKKRKNSLYQNVSRSVIIRISVVRPVLRLIF